MGSSNFSAGKHAYDPRVLTLIGAIHNAWYYRGYQHCARSRHCGHGFAYAPRPSKPRTAAHAQQYHYHDDTCASANRHVDHDNQSHDATTTNRHVDHDNQSHDATTTNAHGHQYDIEHNHDACAYACTTNAQGHQYDIEHNHDACAYACTRAGHGRRGSGEHRLEGS